MELSQKKENIKTCTKCNQKIPVGKQVFDGDTLMCQPCKDAANFDRKIKRDVSKLYEIIPERYRDYMSQTIPDRYCGKNGAFIFGDVGRGKTCLALQIALRAVKAGKGEVHRTNSSSAMGILRDFNSPNLTRTMEIYKNIPILIFDDLGTEKQTDYSNEKIYDIINYRNEWKKFTIITSNMDLENVDDRIASRIAQMCVIIKLDGTDRRVPK